MNIINNKHHYFDFDALMRVNCDEILDDFLSTQDSNNSIQKAISSLLGDKTIRAKTKKQFVELIKMAASTPDEIDDEEYSINKYEQSRYKLPKNQPAVIIPIQQKQILWSELDAVDEENAPNLPIYTRDPIEGNYDIENDEGNLEEDLEQIYDFYDQDFDNEGFDDDIKDKYSEVDVTNLAFHEVKTAEQKVLSSGIWNDYQIWNSMSSKDGSVWKQTTQNIFLKDYQTHYTNFAAQTKDKVIEILYNFVLDQLDDKYKQGVKFTETWLKYSIFSTIVYLNSKTEGSSVMALIPYNWFLAFLISEDVD